MKIHEYPIAEIFVAPQGEGLHVGRLMTFVRLAGCTVGRPFASEEDKKAHGVFTIFQTKCTLYDGRTFGCDTDYRSKSRLSVNEIIRVIQKLGDVKTVCVSGGEPLMHDLLPLVTALAALDKKIHLETSGTIPMTDKIVEVLDYFDHVAVSPKKNFLLAYLNIAHELKILVDKDFEWNQLPQEIQDNPDKIYLQPVNKEKVINHHNVQLCLNLQLMHPEVMLSTQNHKIWETR